MIAIREPSLGPVMGTKGGKWWWLYSSVTNGRYQLILLVICMLSHNCQQCSFCLDWQSFAPRKWARIDQRRIPETCVVDLNDRALRHVTVGLGGPLNGIPRRWFLISQLLQRSWPSLAWQRILKIWNVVYTSRVGYRYDRTHQFQLVIYRLRVPLLDLKDAIKPNLVQQSMVHQHSYIIGGPCNIAHGCNLYWQRQQHFTSSWLHSNWGWSFVQTLVQREVRYQDLNLPTAPSAVVIVATLQSP